MCHPTICRVAFRVFNVFSIALDNIRRKTQMTKYANRHGDWIITYTGKRFYPLDPQEEDIDINDIAHSLSLLNRFTGHTRFPYSVAQHCISVSHIIVPEFALDGLLHDATEAYVNDLAKPLKLNLPDYQAVEDRIHKVISSKFNVCTTNEHVKEADMVALVTEAQALCQGEQWYYDSYYPSPTTYTIYERDWRTVKDDFLTRFRQLYVD